jgi:hypothetical protein
METHGGDPGGDGGHGCRLSSCKGRLCAQRCKASVHTAQLETGLCLRSISEVYVPGHSAVQ